MILHAYPNWCSQVQKHTCFPPTPHYRISLNTLTLNVKSDKVYTRHGVPISVTGIAQVSSVCEKGSVSNLQTFFTLTEIFLLVYWYWGKSWFESPVKWKIEVLQGFKKKKKEEKEWRWSLCAGPDCRRWSTGVLISQVTAGVAEAGTMRTLEGDRQKILLNMGLLIVKMIIYQNTLH